MLIKKERFKNIYEKLNDVWKKSALKISMKI